MGRSGERRGRSLEWALPSWLWIESGITEVESYIFTVRQLKSREGLRRSSPPQNPFLKQNLKQHPCTCFRLKSGCCTCGAGRWESDRSPTPAPPPPRHSQRRITWVLCQNHPCSTTHTSVFFLDRYSAPNVNSASGLGGPPAWHALSLGWLLPGHSGVDSHDTQKTFPRAFVEDPSIRFVFIISFISPIALLTI